MSIAIAITSPKGLSNDTYFKIFSYLEPSQLAICSQVNTDWQGLSSDEIPWANLAQQIFGEKVPNAKLFFQKIESQKLKSNEKIIERLQEFMDRISFGQNARFRCFIGTGSKYQTISIEIKGKINRIDQNQIYTLNSSNCNIKHDCIAIHNIGNGSLANFQRSGYQPKFNSIQTQEVNEMTNERVYACTLPVKGPFQGVLRYPNLAGNETDMEYTIHRMIQVKLDNLEVKSCIRELIQTTMLLGIVALFGYSVGHIK